jgi:hypothetical protein
MSGGDGQVLKVDPELLQQLGESLRTAAGSLPAAPAPFVVTGTDPLSVAIAEKLPTIEGDIQTALPQVKTDATATASNIVAAAGKYQGADAQLAANYQQHQFDQAGAAGAGAGAAGAGAGGAGAMSQMMSMPMQMAGQAAQLPMQAMGAVTSVPQTVMQGVQQIGQMAGGLGKSDSASEVASHGAPDGQGGQPTESGAERPEDREREDKAKQDAQPGAGSGERNDERAPAAAPAPQQHSPRHAAPDPELLL